MVNIFFYFSDRGKCENGKCSCVKGFIGEYCEIFANPESIINCAADCLNQCVVTCSGSELICYKNCSSKCNEICFEKTENMNKRITKLEEKNK